MAARTQRAVPEWQAALSAAQTFDFVGLLGPVGYWGISMGTVIGVSLVAAESRIRCAVFGLTGVRPGSVTLQNAANTITVPIEFTFQWNDNIALRENGIALFNAFASTEKSMHVNPGGHLEIPEFEHASWESFFARHLGTPGRDATRAPMSSR